MHPILYRFISKAVQKKQPEAPPSDFLLAKTWYIWRVNIIRFVKDWILILGGVLTAAFGLEGFIIPNGFIDGGAVGISLLIASVAKWPLWMLLIAVNIPFVLLGGQVFGRSFALKTGIAIGLLALATATIHFPVITQEKLLVAVFGGFFLGTGIGLAVRGGCVIDGTEVLAISLSRKLGMTMGDLIFIINVIIFSVAAWLLSLEIAMYSLLTYMAASRSVDFMIEGVEEYISVMVVSPKNAEIKQRIFQHLGRGVTMVGGKRGIGRTGIRDDQDILFTVVTRLEVGRLRAEIEKEDPNAFVVMHRVQDLHGGLIKKRPMKH